MNGEPDFELYTVSLIRLNTAFEKLEADEKEALEMISRGVRSRGERRARFMERLVQYNAPQELIDNFSKTTNLWSAAACLSRIHFLLQTI